MSFHSHSIIYCFSKKSFRIIRNLWILKESLGKPQNNRYWSPSGLKSVKCPDVAPKSGPQVALPGYDIDKNVFCSEEEYFFEIAEAVFVGWFSFEYVVRFDISSKLLNITIFIQIQSMPDNSNQPIEIMTFPPGSSRLHTSQSKWISVAVPQLVLNHSETRGLV